LNIDILKDQKFIRAYMKKIDLRIIKNEGHFWTQIIKKHGEIIGDRLMDSLENRLEANDDKNFYEIKNETLQLSLDFASYSGDLYRKYFTWIMKQKSKNPKRILDIGCDNGIVTCFYAILFPESEIIGIDIGENAINCARELAKRIGVKNVVFKKSDFLKLREEYSEGYFEGITSLRSIHEIVGTFPDIKYWSIKELIFDSGGKIEKEVVDGMRHLLSSKNGFIITMERLPNIAGAGWLIEQFKHGKIYLNDEDSELIEFQELGYTQRMPILVFDNSERNLDSVERLIHLYTKNANMDIHTNKFLEDLHAEMAFHDIEDKSFIYGVQINFSKELYSMRAELWQQKESLFQYTYSNVGYRELELIDYPIDKAKKTIKQETLQYAFGGNKVFYYRSLDERETCKENFNI